MLQVKLENSQSYLLPNLATHVFREPKPNTCGALLVMYCYGLSLTVLSYLNI